MGIDKNPTGELALLRYALSGLIDASAALGRDAELRPQWEETLCHLAPCASHAGLFSVRWCSQLLGGCLHRSIGEERERGGLPRHDAARGTGGARAPASSAAASRRADDAYLAGRGDRACARPLRATLRHGPGTHPQRPRQHQVRADTRNLSACVHECTRRSCHL